MDSVTPSEDEARPGPAWGKAMPFVAVVAMLFAVVGTAIDVHIVDSWGTPSLGAPKVELTPSKLEAGRSSPTRIATNPRSARWHDTSAAPPVPTKRNDLGEVHVGNLSCSSGSPNIRLCVVTTSIRSAARWPEAEGP